MFCLFQEKIYHWPAKNEILGKYIYHFIFVFFLYFFYHSSCRKDQFTVSFKFKIWYSRFY